MFSTHAQDLLEHPSIGHFTLSHAGEVLELNLYAARLLGLPREKIAGRQMRGFFEYASLASFELFMTTVRQRNAEIFARSLLVRRHLQMPLHVDMQASKLDYSARGPSKVRLTMTDMTGLHNASEDIIATIGKVSDCGPL